MNYRAELIDRYKAARARMGMAPRFPAPTTPRPKLVFVQPEAAPTSSSSHASSCPEIIVSVEPLEWTGLPSTNISPLEIMSAFIGRTEPSLTQIKRAVAARFGFSVLEIESARRTATVARARQAGFWLSRALTRRSLPQIAKAYFRDHSTVMHGLRACEAAMQHDMEYRAKIHLLADGLTARPPFDTHYPGA